MLSSEAKAEGFVQFRGACWMLYLLTRCILKAKRSLQEQNTSTRQERWETTNCRERSCNREQDISDLTLQLQTHQRSSEFKLKLIPDDCPADITVTAAAKSNWTYRVQYSFTVTWSQFLSIPTHTHSFHRGQPHGMKFEINLSKGWNGFINQH